MNFSNIRDLIELINRSFSILKTHRAINLTKTGIILLIFYMCFNDFYLKNRYYHDAKRNNIISKKIGDIVKDCGKNSFISWETIEDSRIELSKRKITFNDVVGCLDINSQHCPVSVKYANAAYLKDYTLGYDDYDYFTNLTTGMLVRCEINNREPNCPDYTPISLKEIIKLTNLELSEITFVTVKDWKRNLVYIFTLSFAKNSVNTCSESGGNMLLSNLADTAMENL